LSDRFERPISPPVDIAVGITLMLLISLDNTNDMWKTHT